MRHKLDSAANYAAIFTGATTLRRRLDRSKGFTRLKYPEVEDVAINTRCYGQCPYCYVAADSSGINFLDICRKAQEVWGTLELEQRPLQIAIGGAGEPTLHPTLMEFCRVVNALGITPNYTTNGMHMTPGLAASTKEFCGGVAISYHPHLTEHFVEAMQILRDAGVSTSIHAILGEPGSAENIHFLMGRYPNVEKFTILPYQPTGRAREIENIELYWDTFFEDLWDTDGLLAFGAGFYDYFMYRLEHEGQGDNDEWGVAARTAEARFHIKVLDLDLFDAELFSGYRVLGDDYKVLLKSSYDPQPR